MDYFKQSHSAYYSIVISIPLLILYELLLVFSSGTHWVVRNAADVWLRRLLQVFEISSGQAMFAMLTLLFISIPFVYQSKTPTKWSYFGYMLLEAFLYSLCLGAIIQWILYPIFFSNAIMQGPLMQRLALSLGAGLFEEFFFRVLLLNALFYTLQLLWKQKAVSGIIAILLASFLFSLSHYVGPMSDAFTLYSFLFRWIAGLLFTALYFLRGFGITAYTHAFYDIMVLI